MAQIIPFPADAEEPELEALSREALLALAQELREKLAELDAREPEDIPVGEVLRLTEGSISPVACLDSSPNECPRCTDCLTLPVWQGLERVINEYLDGVSLRDVLDGNVK